jgi:MYXO-CTERM domain-containing protein
MRIVIASMIVLVPCAAAQAQTVPELVATLAWTEVYAGTNTPVANPNGILEPGEGALLRVSVAFTAVGTAAPFQFPAPGGVGEIAGLNNFLFHLDAPLSGGSWTHPASVPGFSAQIGIAHPAGLLLARALQPWPPPGAMPIATNPIEDVWQAVWTPDSYEPRLVDFSMRTPGSVHGPTPPRLFIVYGTDPTTGAPLLGYGDTVPTWDALQVPVVPGPGAALALMGFAALGGMRRRRAAPAHHRRAITERGGRGNRSCCP